MRSIQQVKGTTKDVFNRGMKLLQRERAAVNKESLAFKVAYDLPLITMTKRLTGIKKEFKKVAFIGPNPYLFLQHMHQKEEIEKFYFCEQSEVSVQKSHDIISQKVNSGFYEAQNVNLPAEMIPMVIDEETEWKEKFQEEELDLIISNMTLHWINNLE